MRLDPAAKTVIDDYLAKAGDLIEGLYLYGSIALDDYRPGPSDIDFVAVTSERLDPEALFTLDEVHRTLPAGPAFEGLYVTRKELAAGPLSIGATPYARERRFHPSGSFEANVITWHTLAERGVRCHGPEVSVLDIWTDRKMLAESVRANLDEYWGAQLESARGYGSEPYPGAIVWMVLGILRLHYTLATGRITSKSGAGTYALGAFDATWRSLVEEALREREGGPAADPERWQEALDFVETVIEAAKRP